MSRDADMTDDEKKELMALYEAGLREGRIKVEYHPVLREPIYSDPDKMPLQPSGNVRGLVGKAEGKRRQAYADKVQAEIDAKWRWLFATYGINDDPKKNPSWAVDLLMALVNQHVPGFRITSEPSAPPKVRKGRGGQRKYHPYDDAYLVWTVDHVRGKMAARKGGGRVTKDAAINRALKEGHFGKLALKSNGKEMTEGAMVSRYYEAEKRWEDHPRNKKLLLEGSQHTPQSLAQGFFNVIVEAMQNTTNNPDRSS